MSALIFVLAVAAGFVAVLYGTNELANRSTYGKYIPEDILLPYLEKNLGEYVLNVHVSKDDPLLSGGSGRPYIANDHNVLPFLKRTWHLYGVGRVRPDGEGHKLIEARYAELYVEAPEHDPYSELR